MKTSNPKYCRCGAPLRKLGKRVMVCERKTSDHKHYWNGAIGLTDPSTIVVLEELDEALSDAAHLRALLRELVVYDRLGEERDYDRCHYCGAWWSVDIDHTGDCPVRRAREEVGDE